MSNKDGKSQDPLNESQKQRLKDFLTTRLARPERLLIVFYYHEEMTIPEIAKVLELPESQVSQMRFSIIARGKSYLQGRGQL